jgi:hypothetical protein
MHRPTCHIAPDGTRDLHIVTIDIHASVLQRHQSFIFRRRRNWCEVSGDDILQVGVCSKSLAGRELFKGSEEIVDHSVPDCQLDWLLVTALRLIGDRSPSLQTRSRAPWLPISLDHLRSTWPPMIWNRNRHAAKLSSSVFRHLTPIYYSLSISGGPKTQITQ